MKVFGNALVITFASRATRYLCPSAAPKTQRWAKSGDAAGISAWTVHTLEQTRIQSRLIKLGITLHTQHTLNAIQPDYVSLSCRLSNTESEMACDAVVLVTDRLPNDALYQALKSEFAQQASKSLRIIGDAEAPNIIEWAVFAGHLAAREFDEVPIEGTPFRMERVHC